MQKIRTYYKSNWRSIDFIPAWNYLEYDKSKDVRFLIKGLDYEYLPEIFPIQKQRLTDIGKTMKDQCTQYEIETNRRNTNIFELMRRIEVKKAAYDYIKNICNYMLVAGPDPDFIKELKKAGFVIDETKDFKGQLRIVLNSNENKLIKINEDTDELEALTKQDSTEAVNSYDELLNALDRFNKKDIDLKKISMKRYLSLKKEMNDYIEKMKSKKVGNGR